MSYLDRSIVHTSLSAWLGQKEANQFIAGETYIPVSGKVVDNQDYHNLLDAILDGHFTEGRWSHDFSRKLANFVGVRHVLPVNSGSSANLVATNVLMQGEFGSKALKPGDKFITTAVGFPTTISPAIQAGLVPVFVDVDFPTYVPDPDQIEEAMGEGVKAIILAHPLGNPFNLTRVREIADEYDIFLLGDCCDALGAEHNGIKVGAVEDISTLSFYPAHHITTGEGGAVMTNSPMMNKVAESLAGWGRACWCPTGKDNTCGKRFGWKCGDLPQGYDHKYTYSRLGYNVKMTDLQAALGAGQLAKLPVFIEKRRHNWQRLHDGISNLPHASECFILPQPTKNSSPSWFGFAITLAKYSPFTRNEIVQHLEQSKIGTRLFFGGNLIRQPALKGVKYEVSGKLYNSEVVMNSTFWIGVYPGITDEMVDYTVSILGDFIKSRA